MGLTEKNVDGLHHLSNYGRIVLQQLPTLEFTYRHRDYFANHILDHLPQDYLSRLGKLEVSTRTEDVIIGFYNVDRMIQEAEEYIWSITDQYLVSQARYTEGALERGVAIRNLDAPYSVVIPAKEKPYEWNRPSFLESSARAREEGRLQEKLMERIPVYLFMSEKEAAALAFPQEKGKFDYLGFTSTDEKFRHWCGGLFPHCWKEATHRSDIIEDRQKWLLKSPQPASALRELAEEGESEQGGVAELGEKGLARNGKLTYLGRVLYLKLLRT
jgi:predicted transcriptional regulator